MSDDQAELKFADGANQRLAEEQITSQSRIIDYRIREYPIEVLVDKYLNGEEDGTNEIFVPDYQRDFVWPPEHQSRFIESVLIGLPIPYLFVADVGSEDDELAGRLEIVDGTQRIRTLAAFLQGALQLTKLEKLSHLNGCRFSDMLTSRQRRFRRITIRLIELTEHADEETRRDMFDRINSGGLVLNPMETRRGARKGPFLDLVAKLATDPRMRRLAPLSESSIKRRDYDELVVRFFAYTDRYNLFDRSVIEFINDYIDDKQRNFTDAEALEMSAEWERVMGFVDRTFPYGFRKNARNTRTPRVRFEAIAVGVALALRQRPDLRGDPVAIEAWAYGKDFHDKVASDGANSRPRVKARIEYVRDQLLSGQ